MGQWKLLLKYKNRTIIEHSIDNAVSYTNKIIISGGYRYNELNELLSPNKDFILINNRNYRNGMITSIKAAVPFVKTDKFFIALSDMPLIPKSVYMKMSKVNFENVLFPVYKGKRGHPVLISSKIIKEIQNSPDSLRIKDILNNYSASEIEIESKYILFDVDTEEDFQKLKDIKENF